MPGSHAMKKYQGGGYVGPDYSQLWRRQAEENNGAFDALSQQPAPGLPQIRIAPPKMSANAQKVIAQAMGMRSDNWGAALSKLASVFVAGRAGQHEAEANAQAASELQSRRQGWGAKLADGMTQRQLAASDPRFISDTAYQGFLKNTAPAPDPEVFVAVDSPFGRGGAAQRSSLTGKLANYQGPLATPTAPQRRIVKGPDGLNYYEDDKSRVLPNVQAPTPERTTPEQAKFEHVRSLAGDWEDATKPVRALSRQRDLMQIGLEAARDGDMAAGSQAVLVTFQKILDPTSVVRESECARSSSGLSVFERVKGAAEKLGKGGAGVSIKELQGFARLADEAVTQLGNGWLTQEQDRIGRFADAYNIPREYVFQRGAPAPQAAPQALEPEMASSQAMMAPTGQPAPKGPAPDQARIDMYAELPPDALERQVQTIAANPDNYSDEEKAAAALAWQQAFGGVQ